MPPKVASKSVAKPAAKSASKPASKSVAKPASKPASKPESKHESKSDSKPESKPEALVSNSKLEAEFHKVMTDACRLRDKGANEDDTGFADNLKKKYGSHDSTSVKWKPLPKTIIDFYKSLIEYVVDGNGKQSRSNVNYLAIQLVRIPESQPATISWVMQLAMNLGELKCGTNEGYRMKLKWAEHKMDKLETYLSPADIDKLSALL